MMKAAMHILQGDGYTVASLSTGILIGTFAVLRAILKLITRAMVRRARRHPKP